MGEPRSHSEFQSQSESPSASQSGPAPTGTPPWGETRVVGQPRPRIDAYERVSGSATYTLDVSLPGMLHAAIVRCPHGHALVKRVDLSKALAMPGVVAVLSAEDRDAAIEWYNEADKGAQSRLFDQHCRFAGEEVAAVAAESPYQAADAARQVVVEYEERPSVVDMDEALKEGAPRVHADSPNLIREPS